MRFPTADEKDIVIEYLDGRGFATVSTSIRSYVTKAKKLAKAYPDEVKIIINQNGSAYIQFPPKWIKFPSPPRKRGTKELTDEQKEILVERMKNARKKREERKKEEGELNEGNG